MFLEILGASAVLVVTAPLLTVDGALFYTAYEAWKDFREDSSFGFLLCSLAFFFLGLLILIGLIAAIVSSF